MSNCKTKEKIFFTAIDMFSSVGYSESSLRELAARVGIKTASLYYYYSSKDELLNSIFDYFLENDKRYRTSNDTIIDKAREASVPEILEMMYVHYADTDDFHVMSKILKIAIGYQYESPKAKSVFNYIYYDMALEFRTELFKSMIEKGILKPFDYEAVAYLMTSFSMMRYMESLNRSMSVPKYTEFYNDGVKRIIDLIAPLISKTG